MKKYIVTAHYFEGSDTAEWRVVDTVEDAFTLGRRWKKEGWKWVGYRPTGEYVEVKA